jgi:hypothetical protein
MDPAQRARIATDAIAHARRAISLAPGVGLYHTSLGEALEASGAEKEAIAEYRKAIDLDPTESYAIGYLKRLDVPVHETWVDRDSDGVDGEEIYDDREHGLYVDDPSFQPNKAHLYSTARILAEEAIVDGNEYTALLARIDAIKETWCHDFGGGIWCELEYLDRGPYFDKTIEIPYAKPPQRMFIYESPYLGQTRFIVHRARGYVPERESDNAETLQQVRVRLAATLGLPANKVRAGNFPVC